MFKNGFIGIGMVIAILGQWAVFALAGLNPLPPGFESKVEKGWLPNLCVRPGNPQMPTPITKDWANPRAGQRVRVLFICASGGTGQYEMLSLARSFDLNADVLALWPGFMGKDNDVDPDLSNLLRYYLSHQHYDVIAMTGGTPACLPDDCEQKIADLITNDGVGFICSMPGLFPRVPDLQPEDSKILGPLMPIVLDKSGYKEETSRVLAAKEQPLNGGVDFNQISWLCNVDATLAEGAVPVLWSEKKGRVLAALVSRGNGRVLALNRCYREVTYQYPFLPSPAYAWEYDEEQLGKKGRWFTGIEFADQFYNWFGHAILWTAKAEPLVQIQNIEIKEGKVTMTVFNQSAEQKQGIFRGVARSGFDTQTKPFTHEWTVLPGATETITVELPDTGYYGRHMVDMFLLDSDRKVLDWSSTAYEMSGSLTVVYKEDFHLYEPNDTIPLQLNVSGPQTCSVRTEFFDPEGRLLWDRTQDFETGNSIDMAIPLAATGISDSLANVRITVCDGKKSREVRDQLFIHQKPDWTTPHIMPYVGSIGWQLHPADDVLNNALKQAGHNTLLVGYPTVTRLRTTAEFGCSLEINNMALGGHVDPNMIHLLRKFSPLIYEMQDEPELQFTPVAETRQGDLDRFHGMLKQKYKNLEKLNQTWEMSHRTWDDVHRVLWHEVVNKDSWSAWFDSRYDLDEFFGGQFSKGAEFIKQADPGHLAMTNPRSIGVLGGMDIGEMTREMGAFSLYCDFVRGGPVGYLEMGSQWVKVAQSCIGYSWPTDADQTRIQREAWVALRQGAKILVWFSPCFDDVPPEGRFTYFNGDLTLNAKGKAIAEVNRQILAGPGAVAVNTEPLDEGIFIYYPRSVFYTTELAYLKKQRDADPNKDPVTITGLGPWMDQMPCPFVPHLRTLGYQFQFGTERDLTAERLKKTRVVFLSHVICLGPRELELLRDFVKAGGCIVAETGTARRDEAGRIYAETPATFQDIFGFKRPVPNLSPAVEKEALICVGANLEEALPGAIYRNGNAFFLNFTVSDDRPTTETINKLLTAAGVKPTFALMTTPASANPPTPNPTDTRNVASIGVRQRGGLTYLFVTGDGDSTDRPFTITLPKEQCVYEMVTHRNLGLRKQITDQIHFGQGRVYALSSSPIVSFTGTADRRSYQPGERVTVRLSLAVQDGQSGDRIIKLEYQVKGDGMRPVIPSTVLLTSGKGDLTFVLPLNGPMGEATIVAQDLTSGTECFISFKIDGKLSVKSRIQNKGRIL